MSRIASGGQLTMPVFSDWVAAHGRLWYDDKWYRLAWVLWPQAFGILLMLWLWAMPSKPSELRWAKPIDPAARAAELLRLRDAARSSQPAMDTLARDATGGEMLAQFFVATLYDPASKLSTIVQPDIGKAVDWYSRAAGQGDEPSLNALALTYASGINTRQDYTRACYYARKLGDDAPAAGLVIKGDCYAFGRGGIQANMALAANIYEAAFNKGDAHAEAILGYLYENGLGGRNKNPETALRYYRDAAEKGDPLGLYNLGYAYNSGLLGLQRDGAEAARLIVRALEAKFQVTVQSLTTRSGLWSSDFWQNLQGLLAEKGLYNGVIDGRANSATLEAVKRLGRS
ncbi:MAG TPA: tetratricopeptide repeat protein [Xanthobacteraceae bacterium]|nr:tetratricopeptide repeat protein [Xanthobacteraceae bacterium]